SLLSPFRALIAGAADRSSFQRTARGSSLERSPGCTRKSRFPCAVSRSERNRVARNHVHLGVLRLRLPPPASLRMTPKTHSTPPRHCRDVSRNEPNWGRVAFASRARSGGLRHGQIRRQALLP